MSSHLEDVVRQLRSVIDTADRAAVGAGRAQADAEAMHAAFTEVSQGTAHPAMRRAVTEARTTSDKLAKLARLLSTAADAFTDYLATIAPGTTPTRPSPSGALASGDDIVRDAERRARRADAAWRDQVRKADDTQDSLKATEQAGNRAFDYFRHKLDPPQTESSSTTAQTPRAKSPDAPQIDNPITAMAMAAGALAVIVKASWNHMMKRKRRTP